MFEFGHDLQNPLQKDTRDNACDLIKVFSSLNTGIAQHVGVAHAMFHTGVTRTRVTHTGVAYVMPCDVT